MVNPIVFFALLSLALGDLDVLLLHTNDMHARFQQTDRYSGMCENDNSTSCYGGFARLHSEAQRLKKIAADKGHPTIFLNAGDSYQGTPYYTFFKWPIVSQFVSMLGIDVMSLGNHEFDDGIPGLAPYIANVTVPIVCSNLNISLEPTLQQPNLTPSKVLNVSGTSIGVIGYLTPDTKTLSNIGNVQIYDEITYVRAEAKRLLQQNVNILIAVGHSGYIKDQQIALEVEDIDVVVGGHSHTFLYTGTPPDIEVPKGPYPTVVNQTSGKQVPVVQAYYATKYLGYLELSFDSQGNLKAFNGSPILLSGDLPQDPLVLEALRPYELNISAKISEILGYSNVLLDNNQMKCKLGECNIGDLITDAYVDYVTRNYKASQGWTKAAIAINQAGGIRASINTKTNQNHNGSITLGDVMTVLPWGSNIVALNMSGEVLKQALEFSVGRYNETITGHVSEFLQVSGIYVVYDMNRTIGERVVSLSVRCADCDVPVYQPLVLNQTYGVVMPQYLAGGGDGFSMFLNLTNPLVLTVVDYEVLSEYIQSHSPIYPSIEGRITIFYENSTDHTNSSAFAPASSLPLWCISLLVGTGLHLG